MAILVGTASWMDKTLIDSGKFYPPTAKSPEPRLKYYASQVPDGRSGFELLRHSCAAKPRSCG